MTKLIIIRRLGVVTAFAVLALDQFSKWLVLDVARVPEHMIEVTPFFNLVMVWNTGVSFGMFAGMHEHQALALTLLTSLIALGLCIWLWRARELFMAFALGLIIGGAVGNIIDRVRFGAVADFLDFHAFGWHWPAFNVADAAIVVGVALLCWESFIVPKN